MQRPEPIKHGTCECCDEYAPLLMPVGFAPGFPVIVWLRLCLSCRLSMTSDKYTLMASDIQHSVRASARDAYVDWLAATV